MPTSWRVREGGGAIALMPWCYTAINGLVRLVGRSLVGMGALSDTAALGDRTVPLPVHFYVRPTPTLQNYGASYEPRY